MDVYEIADKLLEKFSEVPGCLTTLNVNEEAFTNIKKFLKSVDLQSKYDDLSEKPKKSNETATKHRLRGNEFFKDRLFFKALCAYNESLCFAETSSESMGLAFANRSAVYFEIGEFERCKENIELAMQFGYPKSNFNKLEKRKKICFSKQKQQVKQIEENFFKLSHKANPKYPFIVDCLSLKQSAEFGRHVVTKKTLETGDIIAIEPPFSALLLSTHTIKRCTCCYGQFNLNLLPCSGCTSAMFCSNKCRSEAEETFHRIECDLTCENFSKFFTTAVRAAFRTFIQALSTFGGSFEKLRQYLADSEVKLDMTAFDLDFNDESFSRNVFLAMNALSSNEEKRPEVENFRQAIVCTILSEFLLNQSCLSNALINKENEAFFLKFMFRHIQIAESHFHELYSLAPQRKQQENEQFGVGSFPFSSLLNHSCAPNVFRLTFNGFNCIIVSRKIERGEQVFDNYGFHHTLHNVRQRKSSLKKRYQFTCNCQACVSNFPPFEQLTEFDEHFDDFISNDLESLEDFSGKTAKFSIKKYSKYIDEHIKMYPCYEISLLQECVLRCFRVLEKLQMKVNRGLIEYSE